MKTKLALILCAALLLPTTVAAGNFSGGSSSFVGKDSRKYPNIVFIMLDDIGREQYPQLGSKRVADSSDVSFSGTSALGAPGLKYPLQVTGDFPNLDKLLANGINFTGMWSASWCRPSREMLRIGHPGYGTKGTTTTKAHIQAATGNAYEIALYGKNVMGALDGSDDDYVGVKSNAEQLGGGVGWNADGTGVEANPVSDAGLWTIDSKEIMFDDEMGNIQVRDYAEGFYGDAPPVSSNWFSNRTGQPLMLTISTLGTHGAGGTDCVNNRTSAGHVEPTQGVMDQFTSLPLPTQTNGGEPQGPSTPSYDATNYTALTDGSSADNDYYKVWYDCQVTQLKFVDEQLGAIIDWLGPHGLENTLIIFTGDNGSASDQIALRTKLNAPAAADTTSEPTDYVIPLAGTPSSIEAGKDTMTETGLNVPFVVGYGLIPESLRGTSSAARLTFADVAETIVQVVKPNASGYFGTHARDFSGLLDGTAASQDGLGLGAVVLADCTGLTCTTPTSVAAVLDPDPSGDVYRVLRFPGRVDTNCDYVQNLTATDWTENLRNSSDSEVVAARATLDAAITDRLGATFDEDDGC